MVKVRAKEFALRMLRTKQEKHSKMDNLEYKELKMQNYMQSEDLKTKQKKLIFKGRVKMLEFGENYRGGRPQVTCPLCSLHLDNQEMSFQCPVVKSEVDITGNIEDIYKEAIKPETAETLEKILEFRKLRKED